MRKIQALAFSLFVCTLPLLSNAQVKGVIKDFSDSSALKAVTIKVKGSNISTISAPDGSFQINAKTGDILQFSSAGYYEQIVKAHSLMQIFLHKQVKNLEEVVVTAMGIQRPSASLGYAVAKLSGNELIKARDNNFVNDLAGKVSGVKVTSSSGALGSGSKIVIRGENVFSGSSQPLFIIDGLPIDNSSLGSVFPDRENILTGIDYGNKAGDINADDVESITVLKGAAATALYGSRAKNGAIVIVTKKGNRNQLLSVVVNSTARFDKVLKLPDFQNEYANGNYGDYSLKYINGWGPKISSMQNTPVQDFNGDNVILKAYPDNVKDFFETGTTFINNVSVSGGNEISDFRLSLASTNIKGVVPASQLDKYNVDFNVGKNFTKKLSVRVIGNYIKTSANGRPSQASNDNNLLMANIYFPRTLDVDKLKSHYVDPVTGAQVSLSSDKNANNPYWIAYNNKNKSETDRVYGSTIFSYKPVKWLTISDNAGMDFYYEYRKSLVKKGTYGQINGGFSTADIFNSNVNNDLFLTADTKLAKSLALKIIAGTNFFQNTLKVTSGKAIGLTVDDLYTYGNADVKDIKNYYQQSRLIGIYSELGLSYKNYLFMNITGRNDWNSTLPVNSRSYFYPSVSSGFIFSELMHSHSILSFGKLRAGWACVGGGTDPYLLNFTYTPASDYNVQFDLNGSFPVAGGLLGFTGPDILPNENLKPQQQQSFEVGTDLRFLQDRIGLGVTYYTTRTKNQIFGIDPPYSTGYTKKIINAGDVANNGIEADLQAMLVRNYKGFSWTVNVNFNHNKQIVKSIDNEGALQELALNSIFSGMSVKAPVGGQFGLYGSDWKRDPNGNILIDQATGLREVKEDVRLGNISPDWTMGINNTFTYKSVSLSALFDIRQGGVLYSGTVSALRTTGLAAETAAGRDEVFVDKGVYLDGSNNYVQNTVPVASMQDFWAQNYKIDNTAANVFDASYIKLREVRLAWNLPVKKIFAKKVLQAAELGVEARNVLIIKSNVPHIDPEVNSVSLNQPGEGVEFLNMPSTRSIGINLKLIF